MVLDKLCFVLLKWPVKDLILSVSCIYGVYLFRNTFYKVNILNF